MMTYSVLSDRSFFMLFLYVKHTYSMVNKVILIGNLGQDPEVRHLESGSTVARFSLATNERYKDKSGEIKTITEWHDVVVWRNLAEIAEKLLSKGKLVYVEGKLTHRKWQDKDGNNRKTTEVVANNFQILEKKDSSISDQNRPAIGGSTPVPDTSAAKPSGLEDNSLMDDDLPF